MSFRRYKHQSLCLWTTLRRVMLTLSTPCVTTPQNIRVQRVPQPIPGSNLNMLYKISLPDSINKTSTKTHPLTGYQTKERYAVDLKSTGNAKKRPNIRLRVSNLIVAKSSKMHSDPRNKPNNRASPQSINSSPKVTSIL